MVKPPPDEDTPEKRVDKIFLSMKKVRFSGSSAHGAACFLSLIHPIPSLGTRCQAEQAGFCGNDAQGSNSDARIVLVRWFSLTRPAPRVAVSSVQTTHRRIIVP